MGVPDRPASSSPWTVILQGTPVTYESATLLDNIEYAIRVGNNAVERTLSQPNFVKDASAALAETTRALSNPDYLIRTGKLLSSVAEFIGGTSDSHAAALSEFIAALPADLFAPMLKAISPDRELSSWYIAALGQLLGNRALPAAVESRGSSALLTSQRAEYIRAVCGTLSAVAADSAGAPPQEDQADDGGDEADATDAPLLPPRSPVLQAVSSSLGYIPTVPGIGAAQPLNSGDEQLGRVLSGLAAFLSTDANRVQFAVTKVGAARAPSVLAALLDKEVAPPVQVYYQAVFCLWLLSFTTQSGAEGAIEEVAASLEEAAVPRRLTAVLRDVWSEKVVRISLATLRNLLGMAASLRREMVGAGLISALQSPAFRRLDDDDVRDDLGVLADALEAELSSMSSFDVYKAEVLSGALEWTPAHRDELFWKENVEKLERNKQEVLRCMVRLLQESTDETVLAVACNDLAQFIKFHPRGRSIAQSLGVKARLMELMVSGEGEVRRYALNCVQVLMIRWNHQTMA